MKGKGTKLGEWQNTTAKGGQCTLCKNNYERLTVEHIIPSHILTELGLADLIYNDEENFETLCLGCNRLKAGTINILHPKTIPLLKKYIALAEIKYNHVI